MLKALETAPGSSTTEGEFNDLAAKTDFQVLGDLCLTILNSIIDELSFEGEKFRANLK